MATVLSLVALVAIVVFLATRKIICQFCNTKRPIWGEPCCKKDETLARLSLTEGPAAAFGALREMEEEER